MGSGIYDSMLAEYPQETRQQRRNAIFEVNQQIILAGLYNGGFFDHAAFYGGTCLRIFYGLNRFSEDMDFSLLASSRQFDFAKYFQPIRDIFELVGRKVEITRKQKRNFGKVESAFLKDNTEIYDVSFQTEKSVKIKIEVDTDPPLKFRTESKLLLMPESFMARCFTLPDLFAGKMHALVFRSWGKRVKGRDWYDFEWYVRHNVSLDFQHLAERIRQFNGKDVSRDEFMDLLRQRLSSTDIGMVKADVLPFVRDDRELEIWSNGYFLRLADMVRFE